MEFLTIVFSALIGLVTPAGLVGDRLVEAAIRDQFESVDELQVRIDSVPSYRLLQGRVDRLRIAARGLTIEPNLRIAALEVETDPIAVNLNADELELREPLQTGVRLVLSQADLDQALRSSTVLELLDDLNLGSIGGTGYQIRDLRIQLLGSNRIRIQAALQQDEGDDRLSVELETGISILAGRRLQFESPTALLNGEPLPDRIVAGFATGISQRFDLRNMEATGVTARILKLDIQAEQIELAAFVRVEPEAELLSSSETQAVARSSVY